MEAVINGVVIRGTPVEIAQLIGEMAAPPDKEAFSAAPKQGGTDCAALFQAIQNAAAQVAVADANLQAALDAYKKAGCAPS
jgi:hypothetical protein